ncbi:hypothetical protein CS542_10420 [Pedobacter sp. IW39]|nr:hypothetical protein CS542_10420 [Pedobacter sp. IW39]
MIKYFRPNHWIMPYLLTGFLRMFLLQSIAENAAITGTADDQQSFGGVLMKSFSTMRWLSN